MPHLAVQNLTERSTTKANTDAKISGELGEILSKLNSIVEKIEEQGVDIKKLEAKIDKLEEKIDKQGASLRKTEKNVQSLRMNFGFVFEAMVRSEQSGLKLEDRTLQYVIKNRQTFYAILQPLVLRNWTSKPPFCTTLRLCFRSFLNHLSMPCSKQMSKIFLIRQRIGPKNQTF